MTNEIAKMEPNYFEKYGDAATARNIVGRLLKFTKFGEYVAGQENEIVPVGTMLVACMPLFAVGWVRWENNRPVQSEMGYVSDGFVPPLRNDLDSNDAARWERDDSGKPRDPWQFTNSLILIDVQQRLLYTFNTSSKGGLNAMGSLSKAYGRHIKTRPNDLPIIALGVDSYRHSNKAYGEIRFPVFSIEDRWIPFDEVPAIDGLPPFNLPPGALGTTVKEDLHDSIPF